MCSSSQQKLPLSVAPATPSLAANWDKPPAVLTLRGSCSTERVELYLFSSLCGHHVLFPRSCHGDLLQYEGKKKKKKNQVSTNQRMLVTGDITTSSGQNSVKSFHSKDSCCLWGFFYIYLAYFGVLFPRVSLSLWSIVLVAHGIFDYDGVLVICLYILSHKLIAAIFILSVP